MGPAAEFDLAAKAAPTLRPHSEFGVHLDRDDSQDASNAYSILSISWGLKGEKPGFPKRSDINLVSFPELLR